MKHNNKSFFFSIVTLISSFNVYLVVLWNIRKMLNNIQLNLNTTATLGTEESGRCGEVAVMGRQFCSWYFLR